MQFITTGNRIAVENFTIGDLYTITFEDGTVINSACIGIGENFVTFQRNLPELLFSLTMETAELVSSIELYAGGTSTNNYNELTNKPQIGGVELIGNKSLADLGIQAEITAEIPLSSSLVSGLGSAAAAESSDFATAAQGALAASAVQPAALDAALAQKQDALSSAQLSAVNSGITSADVAQITTNKNNILLSADQTTQYNIVPIKSTITTGNASVIATVAADKTITIEITGTTSTAVGFEISDNFAVDTSAQYVMTGCPSSGAVRLILQQAENPYNWIDQQYNNQPKTVTPTYSNVRYYIYIYANSSGTVTIKPMLTPKAIFDAGFTDYQPYALPNTTLTPALAECVDNGAKNLNRSIINLLSNITYSDGTYTATKTDGRANCYFRALKGSNGVYTNTKLFEDEIKSNGIYFYPFTKTSDFNCIKFGHTGSNYDI